MFVDDYTPMKRIGIEELEGCIKILESRIDDAVDNGEDMLPISWITEGAWLALHLMLTGRFKYGADFIAVFDEQVKRFTSPGFVVEDEG